VNSTTLTVDDKNIELGSVASPTDTTASGGGITLKGATDKTILWTAAKGWELSEKIEAPSAILNGNLSAVSGTFSGDVSAVKGTFTGDVTAPHVAANNLRQNYIVLSDAGHNLMDNASLTYDGALLAVTGAMGLAGSGSVSGDWRIKGAGRVDGLFQAQGGSTLSGVVNLPARNGMKILVTDGSKNVADTNLSYVDLGSNQVHLMVGSGSNKMNIDSGAKKLWSSSDLILSASAGVLTLADQTEGLKLANDASNWTAFRAADTGYNTATSFLDCFIAIDTRFDAIATAAAKKSITSAAVAVAAEAAFTVSGPGAFSAAQLTVDNSMVYFNGQLLRSGSVADLAAPAAADYSLDGGYSSMKFSFAVEIGDAIVIQKI
jgi:hypothetical protein